MRLTKVKRVLGRRLAWLVASATASPQSWRLAEERDALDTLLRVAGMHDAERLEHDAAACTTRVLPAAARTSARARAGDQLLARTSALVQTLQRLVTP